MERVIVHFSLEAQASFERLKAGPPLVSQLAIRYYNTLFEFPPDHWLKVRKELGHDTFRSDIRGTVEETFPQRTLKITHFEARRPQLKHTNKHT